MPNQTYDVYFSGEIIDGNDPLETRRQVGNIFKIGQEQLEQLFSGKAVRIKSHVDEETASKYRVAFRNAGALIEIRSSQSEASGDSASTSGSDPSETLTLLPANTGSLEECAHQIRPQPLPDIAHLTLALPGVILDESPQPEPPEIDTDNLSMEPPNSGTLEDCKKEVEPQPIPDISHLDLDKP